MPVSMPRFKISIRCDDRDALRDLVRVHQIKLLNHADPEQDSRYLTLAVADQAEIDSLRRVGYRVSQHEDIDAPPRCVQLRIDVRN